MCDNEALFHDLNNIKIESLFLWTKKMLFFQKKDRVRKYQNKERPLSGNLSFKAFIALKTCLRAESYLSDMISQI